MNNFMATDELELTDEQLELVNGATGSHSSNSHNNNSNYQEANAAIVSDASVKKASDVYQTNTIAQWQYAFWKY
jgi:hypothetical protein